MAEKPGQEKTEKPTPRKLQKARERGNVAKSAEIPSVLILLSALGVFMIAGSWMFWNLSGFMGGIFQNVGVLHLDGDSIHKFIGVVFDQVLKIILPVMITVFFAGFAGHVVQSGFMLSSKPLVPDMTKFNPVTGLKKMVSLKSFVEVIKAIFKMMCIGSIAYIVVKNEMDSFPALMQMEVINIFTFIGSLAFKICFYTCLVMIILATLDFTYQRWQHAKNLMMTKQEVKDESKQSEGDPKVKSKIRQIQLETARRRMMEQVPEADVIVTNPTHLAIALKYDPDKMMAPKVIAKGAGFIAERIKTIAGKKGIPVLEHKSLARTLFKSVDLGEFIPANLYRAVAEILAYVYNLKKGQTSP